jgi:hypothetical protein
MVAIYDKIEEIALNMNMDIVFAGISSALIQMFKKRFKMMKRIGSRPFVFYQVRKRL